MLLVYRRDVIKPIKIADRLRIGLVLDQFSVPRWSNPICGSTRRTTSPSSSKTRRKTPCAAGCCGPKFIVKFRVKASAMVASTTARPTHWRPVGFYSTAPTGLKFGSRLCLLWVRSGHSLRFARCPLYRQKQTVECVLRKPPSITTPPHGQPPRSHYLRLLPSKYRRDFVIHFAGPFGVLAESSAFRAGG